MRWNPPFPGDKIPPSIWVLVGVSEWLETHPDDVPDLGAKRFGLNGLWGAFDHLHSQDPSAERIRCQRRSTPILPQLECVLVVASQTFFWIFTPKFGEDDSQFDWRTFFKWVGKKATWQVSWNKPWEYFASTSSVNSSHLMPCAKTVLSDDATMRRHVAFTGDADGVVITNAPWWIWKRLEKPEYCIKNKGILSNAPSTSHYQDHYSTFSLGDPYQPSLTTRTQLESQDIQMNWSLQILFVKVETMSFSRTKRDHKIVVYPANFWRTGVNSVVRTRMRSQNQLLVLLWGREMVHVFENPKSKHQPS